MKKSSAAFTLVELLVVIVIISILAGFALPVFQKAQEKSRAVSDMSNLRQIGIGVQAFKSDNNGEILDTEATIKWPQKLNPTYISSWKVFKSPFDTQPSTETAASARVSYGINDENPTSGTVKLLGIDSSKVNYPSNLIMMAPVVDLATNNVTFPNANLGNTDVLLTTPGVVDKGTHQARKRVNVLYADGHTEDILWSKFMIRTGDEGLKRWVYDYLAP